MATDSPLTQIVAVGLVVVHRDNRRFRFLALRRFSEWDFVVGGFDAAADPQQVAIDEARELTGITDLTFPWGDDHRDTLPVEDNQVSRYYLAQTETEDWYYKSPWVWEAKRTTNTAGSLRRKRRTYCRRGSRSCWNGY